MATCFVIQPFDKEKFDKRYNDCFKPAIVRAGLEPYRVDGDPSAEVLISSIEDGIKNASVCLAEISLDNANVWYELGYAFALGKPVVMVCADERTKFPFDIQHRQVLVYKTDSTSDFDNLGIRIEETLNARLSKAEMLKQAAESELVSDVGGVSHAELVLIAAIASEADKPTDMTGLRLVKQAMERQGIAALGCRLAVRRLLNKSFAILGETEGDYEPYNCIQLTDKAWMWIEANDTLFVTSKPNAPKPSNQRRPAAPDDFLDDEIPF